jgi:hypothetical protein
MASSDHRLFVQVRCDCDFHVTLTGVMGQPERVIWCPRCLQEKTVARWIESAKAEAVATARESATADEPAREDPKALAEAHWGYVREVLLAHDEFAEIAEKCGFHYRSAFVHGFKHGVESRAQKTCRGTGICDGYDAGGWPISTERNPP